MLIIDFLYSANGFIKMSNAPFDSTDFHLLDDVHETVTQIDLCIAPFWRGCGRVPSMAFVAMARYLSPCFSWYLSPRDEILMNNAG